MALADLGHIYAVYRVLGSETFWDVGQWNDMIWGKAVGIAASETGLDVFPEVCTWTTEQILDQEFFPT